MEKINGICHRGEMKVQEEHLANRLGSGELEVFGTPALIAFMENICMESIKEHIGEGNTTVGISISCEHLKASLLGAELKCLSCVSHATEKIISFTVEVYEGDKLIGKGAHDRAIVDIERFMSKVSL